MKTMKKAIAFILMVALVFSLVAVFTACDWFQTKDENFEYSKKDDGTYMVLEYLGSDEDVVIPSTFKGKEVTDIWEDSFRGKDFVKSIKVSKNIKMLRNWGTRSLKVVTFEEGSQLEEISLQTFMNCELEYIELPVSLTKIGHDAFHSLPTTISYAGTLEEFLSIDGIDVLMGDSHYTTNEKLLIGGQEMKNLVIPEGLTKIMADFSSCPWLESVTIGQGPVNVGGFSYNSNLKTVDITGNSVTDIWGLNNCEKLTSVSLPASLKEIHSPAFSNCPQLTSVNFAGTMEQWKAIKGRSALSGEIIRCSDGDIEQ